MHTASPASAQPWHLSSPLPESAALALHQAILADDLSVHKSLKDNPHNLVVHASHGDLDLVLKVPRGRNRRWLREGLLSLFRSSPAMRMAKSHQRLLSLGFCAPEPVLVGERKGWGFTWESYFAYRFMDAEPVNQETLPLVVQSLESLHRLGYTRRDPLPRNFLIRDGEVVYIDIGVCRPLFFRRTRCMMEYVRFLRDAPTAMAHADATVTTSLAFRLARALVYLRTHTIGRWNGMRRRIKQLVRSQPEH